MFELKIIKIMLLNKDNKFVI